MQDDSDTESTRQPGERDGLPPPGFFRRHRWRAVLVLIGGFGLEVLIGTIRFGAPSSWGDWIAYATLTLLLTAGVLFGVRVRETLDAQRRAGKGS